MPRRLVVALAFGLSATVLALAAAHVPFIETLEWKIYDQLVRWTADPAKANRDIVLVTIDEKSIRLLEPLVGRWPWPRLLHGQLVDFLARGPAKVIAYDVLFTERDRRLSFLVGEETWSGTESDRFFAESVDAAGSVVMVADATFEGSRRERPGGAAAGAAPVRRRDARRPLRAASRRHARRTRSSSGPRARWATTSSCSTPTAPSAAPCPTFATANASVPSLGLAAALVAGGHHARSTSTPRGRRSCWATGGCRCCWTSCPGSRASRDATATGLRALIDYRGPAGARGRQQHRLPDLLVLRPVLFAAGAARRGRDADGRSRPCSATRWSSSASPRPACTTSIAVPFGSHGQDAWRADPRLADRPGAGRTGSSRRSAPLAAWRIDGVGRAVRRGSS